MPDPIQHRDAPLGKRHPLPNFTAASEASRLALAVTQADVGSECIQTDTNPPTFWRLARVTGGIVWLPIGQGGMTSDQTTQLTNTTAAAAALRTPTYLVETASNELQNERVLEGASGVTVDFATAGKAIVKLTSTPAAQSAVDALKAPTFIVQTASAALDNERVLEGADGVTIDYGTAGKAIVRGTGGGGGGGVVGGAPTDAEYLVATSNGTLSAERVLGGADGVTVDYSTPGQAIVRGPTIPAAATPAQLNALRTPTFLVQTAHAELDNERALEGADGVTIDFGTPGKAIVRGPGAAAAGAPADAEYIVRSANGTLSAERVLETTGGLAIDWTQAGKAIVGPGTALDLKADLDFSIVTIATSTATLALAHRGKFLLFTSATGATLTIPKDATTNLPIGFTCVVMYGVQVDFTLNVVSETSTGTNGVPARYAPAYSDAATPRGTYGGPWQQMTLIKVAADTWTISGHYVA